MPKLKSSSKTKLDYWRRKKAPKPIKVRSMVDAMLKASKVKGA